MRILFRNLQQIADSLGVSRKTLYTRIREGKIQVRKLTKEERNEMRLTVDFLQNTEKKIQ